MKLTEDDYRALAACYIPSELADEAGIYRVDSHEGSEAVGRNGAGNFSGQIYPYRDPVTHQVVGVRLRLDHPPIGLNGKPDHKYLGPPGQRNHLFFPLASPATLRDTNLPIVISEGEKKYLSLEHAAREAGRRRGGEPTFLPLGLAGVWSWRGVVGVATDSSGHRVPQKGTIPDFDRLVWKDRKVYIVFDVNVLTNPSVAAARAMLARELESRGAHVYFINLPPDPGINGVDDYLAAQGLETFLDLMNHAARRHWQDELVRGEKGKILATLSNAILALEWAPEWTGVLGFNSFALQVELLRPPPWEGAPVKNARGREWGDNDDTQLIVWLESNGVRISDTRATRAAAAVARGNDFNPLRLYLESLRWDGIARLDDWLTMYLGARGGDDYIRAVGARWMIGAVARAYQPGCKVDHVLILEGAQGLGKSTVFEILGAEFYSDDIAELGSKDAQLGVAGVWIVELAELDAMGRAEISKIKRFLSEKEDRFRPPYARHLVWVPRQCVFGGSINVNRYLKDETGGRRFWPVPCGPLLRLESLRRDRDQLWAEAVMLYQKGVCWWLDTPELVASAAEEQEERYQADPWEPVIDKWLEARLTDSVTTADVLAHAIEKRKGDWNRADEIRVGVILGRLNWKVSKRPRGGGRRRVYEKGDE